ncbi:MAG: hypothetical protein KC766_09800 [Myxococcales bacterium]|nr:hypothetical protein [Myxococcales bacterium]
MRFDIHGPFTIPRTSRQVDKQGLRVFWQDVEASAPGLSTACGCYVFVLQAAGTAIRPWYVGKAEKQTFRAECLQQHKLKHYNEVLATVRGTPKLFLLAKRTPKGKFSKPTAFKYTDVRLLENHLIGMALAVNRDLRNTASTMHTRKLIVPGFFGTPVGRPNGSETDLKKTFKLG